jgi:hypothetical protein
MRQHVGHAVGQPEQAGDRADVPDVVVAEAVTTQGRVVGVDQGAAVLAHLERERQHRALTLGDVGPEVVGGHLVGQHRLPGIHAQQSAVRHHAVQAIVGRRGGDDDHFAFGPAERGAVAQHQRVVPVEERAGLGRPVREGQEHVGHEAGLGLHLEDAGAQVLGQVGHLGHGPAGNRLGHVSS